MYRSAVSSTWFLLFAALALAAGTGASDLAAQQPRQAPPSCEDTPGFHRLDFWVGDWDVFVQGKDDKGYDTRSGANRIEKILDGCAVMEHWSSSSGGDGKSLFFYTPGTGEWKQVWVTGNATRPGGVKEKTLTEEFEDGGVRFQGTVTMPNGQTYLDRTTLTPMEGGKVRQVIEISTDGGQNWRVTFDGAYVPRK